MTRKFTIIITKEKKWYVARCIELGVVSQGKTVEEAQKNLREAVGLYLEDNPKIKTGLSGAAPLITTFDLNCA
jgi:predicted RNase H-like HicB family nuclease